MHRLETGPPARNVTLRVWNWENYRDGERGRGVLVSGVCFCSGLLYGKVMALRGREAGAELHARFGEETEGKCKRLGPPQKSAFYFQKQKPLPGLSV